jgi:chitin disaccharide deacetylase
MDPSPLLNEIGLSRHDRLVIIHADDTGMCHASLRAYEELTRRGFISSASTMVPCSWFPSVASYCRENPKTDMGVHLTLTSEWNSYRWRPLSTTDPNSGIIDSEGYFFRTSEELQAKAEPDAVKLELQAQINRALSAGINITHVDTHMFSVAHPKFVRSYIELALQLRMPLLLPRMDEMSYHQLGFDNDLTSIATNMVHHLEDQGIPLVDFVTGLDLDKPQNRLKQAKKALSELPPGITHFIIHPAIDTLELRAIAPDWKSRVADFRTFMDEDLQKYISQIGLHVIGYQTLKDQIRSS